MKYIAIYDGTHGCGDTLEEAFDDLENDCGGVNRDDVEFYETKLIQVEFKIIEKTKPIKINKPTNAGVK